MTMFPLCAVYKNFAVRRDGPKLCSSVWAVRESGDHEHTQLRAQVGSGQGLYRQQGGGGGGYSG